MTWLAEWKYPMRWTLTLLVGQYSVGAGGHFDLKRHELKFVSSVSCTIHSQKFCSYPFWGRQSWFRSYRRPLSWPPGWHRALLALVDLGLGGGGRWELPVWWLPRGCLSCLAKVGESTLNLCALLHYKFITIPTLSWMDLIHFDVYQRNEGKAIY